MAFETGGSKLIAALVSSGGRVLERKIAYRDPEQKAEQTIAQVIDLGAAIIGQESISSIGFGFGGTVERPEGRPTYCFHEEGWAEVNLRESLREHFPVPIFVENDCNLAALAEAHFGFSETESTLLYVTLGTGIGAGIIHQGRILELGRAGEAELGHIPVSPEGPDCPCGNRGCLETLCSGPGLEQLAFHKFDSPLTSKEIMAGLHERDSRCIWICSDAARFIARALGPAINMIAPSIVVFGGGVMFRNQPLLEMIRAQVLRSVFPPFRETGLRLELSRLNEDVVCRGAALLALQRQSSTH